MEMAIKSSLMRSADVSLATFYVFDKEDLASGSNVELVRHGCHGCHGYGGRGWVSPRLRLPWVSRPHGCHGCGCGGWRWGGCGGCGCWCVRVGGVAVCGR